MPYLPLDSIRVDSTFEVRLPQPSEREFRGLVDDIRSRGVIVDLLITKDGLLLDGHRRLAAAKEAGLSKVPVKTLDLEGEASCERALAIVVNLFRRNLTEAQRVALGSSLLRIERARAKERQSEGQKRGGEIAGRGRKLLGNDSPNAKEHERATERVAGAVGVSRKTFERAEAVKKKDPEIAKRMLQGSLSVASAYKKVKVKEIKERAAREEEKSAGVLKDLHEGFGRYRTVYLDPPWQYRDTNSRGAAESHYPTMSLKELSSLPVPKLGHEEGARFWIWCTWPLIRIATKLIPPLL